MNYRLLTIFLLTTIFSSGQTIAPFKDADFSADRFVVKKEQLTLGTITVDLIHAKPKKQDDSRQFSCRTWLTIKDKNKFIKELAQDADAVGGCSGLFFPDSQPSKDLIIISKFGDYDGRLYLVNSKGEFKNYLGGTFYVSNDNKYLFTNYDSDLSGVSIIDLTKNELIYTGEPWNNAGSHFAYGWTTVLNLSALPLSCGAKIKALSCSTSNPVSPRRTRTSRALTAFIVSMCWMLICLKPWKK